MEHLSIYRRRFDMTGNMTVTVEVDQTAQLISHPYRVQISQWIRQDDDSMECQRQIQFLFTDHLQAFDKYHRLCDRVEAVMSQTIAIIQAYRLPYSGTAEPVFEE